MIWTTDNAIKQTINKYIPVEVILMFPICSFCRLFEVVSHFLIQNWKFALEFLYICDVSFASSSVDWI